MGIDLAIALVDTHISEYQLVNEGERFETPKTQKGKNCEAQTTLQIIIYLSITASI